MNNEKISTMLIVQGNRTDTAVKVQEILTRYGCSIKARLGLHEADEKVCTNHGLIFLHLTGPEETMQALEEELNAVPHTRAQLVQLTLE